jgi:hypothetical protein
VFNYYIFVVIVLYPMNRKVIYTTILGATLAFTLFEELYLRKYLFKHHSYLLAGSLPNFLAPIIMSFIYMAISNPTQGRTIIKTIASLVSGLILYEIVQLLMPRMVFDINDIIASILGGLLSYALISFINRPSKTSAG